MYILALCGNLLIILTVSSDSHLHTPMYFFLSNLSIVDIGFVSTTVPRLIVNIQTHCRVISYVGCIIQMSLFIIFGCMDSMILAVMAYDRFVAICHPLYYQVIMNPNRCGVLLLGSFLVSLAELLFHYVAVIKISRCEDFIEISNFFCGPSEVLKLAHFDTITNNIVRYCTQHGTWALPPDLGESQYSGADASSRPAEPIVPPTPTYHIILLLANEAHNISSSCENHLHQLEEQMSDWSPN
ncbi:hypothetical protein U0070_008550 [Myodes glareolus]|uniref:G-protein coupled receptors family 1 profile domain-containing protein n=1 Tax=Myodes glareolus TaxID=447135 RepID=A0AAW0HJR8_MYOGA